MKGKVIMRYVGSRQEPEEKPIDTTTLLFVEEPAQRRMEKFIREWDQKIQKAFEMTLGRLRR